MGIISDDEASANAVTLTNVQLFLDSEDKTQEALSHFSELAKCHYSSKKLGDSNQEEQMTCDCSADIDHRTGVNRACGEDSDCINRLTSVECVNDVCTCGDDCQNQRFQRKQYAKVSVIQTEKKGYGLRADRDIAADTFIYEYIGDVIDEATFRQRMVKYDQAGFKHFYFMMLQKNEFIDATQRGCLARFCNHSCRPNAFVDKWVVGKKLKMGIFSKRKILKGEEITFDYNVDRYGAQAQPCYCGESNCIGFMGGKTQTDSASLLPQIVAEALGVTPSQEKEWLKMMKANGRKIKKEEDSNINEEFITSLEMNPLRGEEVSKVMSALLRSQELIICKKLIERIWLSDDNAIHTRVIRMHGYEIFSSLLRDTGTDDPELVQQVLEILLKWPRVTKNKISSSKIEQVVQDINDKYNDEQTISSLASQVLSAWSRLEMAYRIPKRGEMANSELLQPQSQPQSQPEPEPLKLEDYPANRVYENSILPEGWEWAKAPGTERVYFYNRTLNVTQWNKPVEMEQQPNTLSPPKQSRTATPSVMDFGADTASSGFSLKRGRDDDDEETRQNEQTQQAFVKKAVPQRPANFDKDQWERERLEREKQASEASRQYRELEYQKREEEARKKMEGLNNIISRAQKDAEERKAAEQRLKEEEIELKKLKQQRHLNKQKLKESRSKGNGHHQHEHGDNSQQNKEKAYKRLFANVVPNMIKKYETDIGHDNIKACARDIVNILTEKEMKRHADLKDIPSTLSNEKKAKVKHFSKSYMEKFLIKYREKEARKQRKPEKDEHDENWEGEAMAF